MTEEQGDIEFDQISICTYSTVNDNELMEYFRSIASYNFRGFLNRVVDIDDEDIEESEIQIAPTGVGDPEESEDHILIDWTEDEEKLHIHSYFSEGYIDDMKNLYSELIDLLGELEVRIVTVELTAGIEFDRLDVPVDRDSEYDPVGVRFELGDNIYLIQEARYDDEDGIYVLYQNLEWDEMNEENAKTFIEESLNSSIEAIGDLKS